MRMPHDIPSLVAVLLFFGYGLEAKAEPGRGLPLSATTGTVHNVSTVASLRGALDAANAAGVPATILLEDGTYNLAGATLHITCPGLIVRSAGGNREAVVVRGPDEGPSASTYNLFLVSADNVTLADMTFGYCRWHGVQIRGESPYDVSGTRIHNCRIVNCNEQFIKGSSGSDPEGATDGIIESCRFEFTAGWAYQYYTGGIDIHKGVNWVVRDNVFKSIRNPTAQPNIAEHAVHFWKRCTTRPQNIVVERNWIIDCDRGIGFGLGSFDNGHNGGGSVIRNNVVVNDGAGGHTDVGIGLESANDVTVDNNTVYIPAYWAPMEYRFSGSSNLWFRNNLVNSAIQNRDGAPAAQFSNNIENAQAGWFANVASGDLRLNATAITAIDRGSPIDAFTDDIYGAARPALGGWDVGAHEYRPAWAGSSMPALTPFDEGLVPVREIHVSPSGNDTTGNGAPGSPYRTLSHAASLAAPGAAIVLAPGTYPGGTFLHDLRGMATAPIWIRGADPANRPVISGASEGMHLIRARFLVVEHLEVTGSADSGINCDDGGAYADPEATRHVVFRNLYIHDIGGTGNQDGLKLSGLDDFWVLDSDFARCGGGISGSGIDHVGCHRGVIAGCSFIDMSGNAIQCKGGSAQIDITRCHMVDAGQRGINIGGSTGLQYFRPPVSTTATNYEARAIRVMANVFKGSITPVAFVGCIDSLVAHNTIIDPEDWFLRILQETTSSGSGDFFPCRDSAFVNNLVYFERSRMKTTDINVGANTAPQTFTLANNLWCARDDAGSSAPDYPVTEMNGIVGEDPLLADPPNGVYTITLSSPAAGAGLPLGIDLRDYAGQSYLDAPAIGAHEIGGDVDGDQLGDHWEMAHFGDTTASNGLPHEDADADRFPDRSEYVAGTDPMDPASYLHLSQSVVPGGMLLQWAGVPGRTYSVHRAAALASPFQEIVDGLPAQALNDYLDPISGAAMFHRIAVEHIE